MWTFIGTKNISKHFMDNLLLQEDCWGEFTPQQIFTILIYTFKASITCIKICMVYYMYSAFYEQQTWRDIIIYWRALWGSCFFTSPVLLLQSGLALLVEKLIVMQIDVSIVYWIVVNLTGSPQYVHLQWCLSDRVVNNTGTPFIRDSSLFLCLHCLTSTTWQSLAICRSFLITVQ